MEISSSPKAVETKLESPSPSPSVGISPTAYQKLSMLRKDLLAMSVEEGLEFVRRLRARRSGKAFQPKEPKPLKIKAPKLPKAPRLPKAPKVSSKASNEEPTLL